MRRVLLLAIFLCGFAPCLFAQRYYSDELPRYELGLQFDIVNLHEVGASAGLGLRFHYNFNEHVALDSELSNGSSSLSTGSQASPTNFLTGVRVGRRIANSGFF